MKNYSKNVIILATILSLSTFSGCSQIDENSNIDNNNDSDTSESISAQENEIESEPIAELETFSSQNNPVAELETFSTESVEETSAIVSMNDMSVSDSNINLSQGISQTDASTTVVETNASVVTLPQTSISVANGFDVPVDGNVSNNNIVVQSISLSKNQVTIEVGESDMPIVSMSPSDASDKSEIWESSNTQVATVDGLGNITGIAEGTCTVTVKAKANTSVYAEISVTVVAKKETQDNLNPNNSSSDDVTEPTYIEGILVVNKTYALPKDYNPYGGGISPEVQEAFNKMEQDARAEGLTLYISSGFRSYDYQAGLYERYAQRDGYEKADTYSARAGHSEHQTGLCFDLNTIDDSFANTPEGKWVAENCYKYGFIIRYPKGKESITGYQYEPWHLRYLGEFLATDVYNSGLCLEEYLGITSKYAD